MSNAAPFLNVLLPVYNEQERLFDGVTRTVALLEKLLPGDYVVTIVDNASQDATPIIASVLAETFPQVNSIRLEAKGVGVAFRAGVAANRSPIVGYMDVDLSTDIAHLAEVIELFATDPSIEIVNGVRWTHRENLRTRRLSRNITSQGLTFVLKLTLGMKAPDAICGFKFFRADSLATLMAEVETPVDGWSYVIELLLRAERDGRVIVNLPVRWTDDDRTTVQVGRQIVAYLREIARIRRQFREERI